MAQLTEHSAKTILSRFGVPFSSFRLVASAAEAAAVAAEMAGPVAVKAQLPVGGRGKAGGVQRAESSEAARRAFEYVTTVSVAGLQAVTAVVEPWCETAIEVYLGVTIDAMCGEAVVLFGAGGGVDVERTDEICRVPLREDLTLSTAAFRRAAAGMPLERRPLERLLSIAQQLVRVFVLLDCRVIELNPLLLRGDDLVAADARIVVDDHALFRQAELWDLVREARPRYPEDEVRDRVGLEYVRLGGRLGLISGGAGMTMAAMDLIAAHGVTPACFLDCSANPTPSGYGAALDLLLFDPQVEAILISIFGGLTRMDSVARTLVELFESKRPAKPVTVRLRGTNGDAAAQVLASHNIVNHFRLEDAVEVAVSTLAGRAS